MPELKQRPNSQLKNLLVALGYQIHGSGTCFGSAVMAMQAIFLKDDAIQHFNDRIGIIADFDYSKLQDVTPSAVEAALKQHYETKARLKSQDPKTIQAGWVDLRAFLEGVAISQDSFLMDEAHDNIHLSQDVETAFSFVASIDTEKVATSVQQIGKFSHLYDEDEEQELNDYFRIIDQVLSEEDFTQPFCMLLSNWSHAILVGCYKKEGERFWFFFDMNGVQFIEKKAVITPIGRDLEKLANFVLDSFSKTERCLIAQCAMTTKCYALGDEKVGKKVIEKLMADTRWKDLHTVDSEKAMRTNDFGVSWLILAVKNGELDTVAALLKAGADPNQIRTPKIDTDGSIKLHHSRTALFIAAKNKDAKMVKLLLDAGADPKLMLDAEDPSALRLSSQEKIRSLKLTSSRAKIESSGFNSEILRLLYDAGIDPKIKDSSGMTVLWTAAKNGDTKRLECQLRNGANPNSARESDQTSALWVATQNGHIDIVKRLLAYQADPCLERLNGESPIWIAVHKKHADIVELLLKAGADPRKARASDGVSPLFLAVMHNRPDIVELLLKAGADPLQPNCDGTTPLAMAEKKGLKIVEEILKKSIGKPAIGSFGSQSTVLLEEFKARDSDAGAPVPHIF